MSDESDSAGGQGLLGSLRRLAGNVAQLAETRLELFSTDAREARDDLVRAALVVAVVLFSLQAGALMAVLFFVVSMSREHLVLAIGIAAGVLLLIAGGGAFWLFAWLKGRPPMFGSTLAELRKDRDRLRGRS
jgi:uncharacterized membrane protein YqjE